MMNKLSHIPSYNRNFIYISVENSTQNMKNLYDFHEHERVVKKNQILNYINIECIGY